MTSIVFLFLLGAYALIACLITEAIKKLVPSIKNYNVVALVTALVVGLIGTFVYYIIEGIPITFVDVIFAILLSISSGVGSMVGYDKVIKTIKQIIDAKKSKKEKEEIVVEEITEE